MILMNYIVLFELLIFVNIGNIVCMCVVMNMLFYLIEFLGFLMDDKYLKWVGLDYWNDVNIIYYSDLEVFLIFLGDCKLYLILKFVYKVYSEENFVDGEEYFFLFGKEIIGLLEVFMCENEEKCLCIFMNDEYVCLLNLLNIVVMIVYEVFC